MSIFKGFFLNGPTLSAIKRTDWTKFHAIHSSAFFFFLGLSELRITECLLKKTAIKTRYTKSAILAEIAENTDLSRKRVGAVFDELADLIERHIKKGGAGEFTMPGLLKIKTVNKTARKALEGVPNPFRLGKTMDIAANRLAPELKFCP